jgi:hypothetical protein
VRLELGEFDRESSCGFRKTITTARTDRGNRQKAVSCGGAGFILSLEDRSAATKGLLTRDVPTARILRMAAYTYSRAQIERMVARSKRARTWYGISAIAILVSGIILLFLRPERRWAETPFIMIFAILVPPLVRIVWNWKSWDDKLRNSVGAIRVNISADRIGLSRPPNEEVEVKVTEIVRAEEPSLGSGLCLRTLNRYHWLFVPGAIDGYEAIKRELAEMGLPVVKTYIPPNWEEFAGALLFCVTCLCALFLRSINLLALNLLISVLVAIGGSFVIRSNPVATAKARWSMYFLFLPAVASAWGIWTVIRS